MKKFQKENALKKAVIGDKLGANTLRSLRKALRGELYPAVKVTTKKQEERIKREANKIYDELKKKQEKTKKKETRNIIKGDKADVRERLKTPRKKRMNDLRSVQRYDPKKQQSTYNISVVYFQGRKEFWDTLSSPIFSQVREIETPAGVFDRSKIQDIDKAISDFINITNSDKDKKGQVYPFLNISIYEDTLFLSISLNGYQQKINNPLTEL